MLNKAIINKIDQGADPSQFAASGCLSPIRRRIRLSETAEYKDIFVNCGHCKRCLQQKREELASRMFLHSLDFKYCYYVTLDYGSYDLSKYKYHPFKASWLQTVPIITRFNSKNQPRWTPTLLIRSHLTNFQKRLRKLVNGQLSFAACGEYGEDFLRPHFHLIVWSNEPITFQMFKFAWSLECEATDDHYDVRPFRGISQRFRETKEYHQLIEKYRQSDDVSLLDVEKRIPLDVLKKVNPYYFRFYIGDHLKVEDLWANGSLDYDGKHPATIQSDKKYNGIHNFTYVAKYLGKCGFNWMPKGKLLQRFSYAYAVYTRDIDKLMEISPFPFQQQLDIYEQITNAINYETFDSKNFSFKEFKTICSPYFVSSRRPSLGKIYYSKNRARFQRKELSLPTFMGKEISYPKYFFYLLSLDNYSVRLRKNADSGISLTKDFLPRLYRYMVALRDDSNYWYTIRGFWKDSQPDELTKYYYSDADGLEYSFPYRTYHGYTQRSLDQFEEYSLDGHRNYLDYKGALDCIDIVTSEGTVHYIYSPNFETFEGRIYNRLTKDYDFYDIVDREDFCDFVLQLIEKEYAKLPEKVFKLDNLFSHQLQIEEHPNTPIVRQDYLDRLNELQLKYKSSHHYEL